ncbi:Mitochondrial distribution and morphology protein 31, mitochondrial precursor [Nowakowskiella sp. JEL0407]|nr:Mitochondrial distribution and morphology protein 31, mitochondrial precursor [Nowakowskiella sp. JEL0407]
MFSWFFVGNTLVLLAATTSCVSLALWLANSLQFQEFVAKKIGDFLSSETGFTISFESAIVPRWRQGVIRLTNVSLLCTGDSYLHLLNTSRAKKSLPPLPDSEYDRNWTYWDVSIQSVDVTLSLWRWIEGRGLIKECTMKGVRGTVDRTHIKFDPNWTPKKRQQQFGDFELDRFVVEDLLFTVHQPNQFRPYAVSVFSSELSRFRKQWLLFDLVCAESIVGMFDNCLFSVHKPQSSVDEQRDGGEGWFKMSHLKINGVPIDHFNSGLSGPVGWIRRGTMDVDLHVRIPQSTDDDLLEFFRDIEGIESTPENRTPSVLMYCDVKLNDLKASVPLVTPHISYLSNAMIRPIVAYMNANKTSIPLQFGANIYLENFNGAWDVYAAGLVDVFSEKMGRELTLLVEDERERLRRLKRVGLWSIQTATKGLVTVLDYARGEKGWESWGGGGGFGGFSWQVQRE